MKRTCVNCGNPFEITNDDLAFYEKISPVFNSNKCGIPPPTRCPECRQQRRLSWRNERSLFKRKCSATGKDIVSIHHADTPFPVYDQEYFWSDKWDPYSFGQEVNLSRSFIEQFTELHRKVPQISVQSMANQNSEYVNLSSWNRNSYLLFESDNNQDCLYCDHTFYSQNALNNSYVERSELAYECLYTRQAYSAAFCQNCENVTEALFLKNCMNCKQCFGCINLRNKQYCLFNEQLDAAEYSRRIAEMKLNTMLGLKNAQQQVYTFFASAICKHYEGASNENVVGNYIWNSKDVMFCFDVKNCRDCKYVCNCQNTKDAYDIDVYGGDRGMELVYEGNSVGNGCQRIAFSTNLFHDVSDAYYCDFCHGSSHLFGCIALRKARYCILNKKYSQEQYEELVPKLIGNMINDGEWGEFFPTSISPYGYNKTVAQEYYPLERKKAIDQEWHWHDDVDTTPTGKTIDALQLPDVIGDIPDDVLNWSIHCPVSHKLFRFQKKELEFHRRMQLPLPRTHPDIRYGHRMTLRLPRKLHIRKCQKCSSSIYTTYEPERSETVYCEECYLKEVY